MSLALSRAEPEGPVLLSERLDDPVGRADPIAIASSQAGWQLHGQDSPQREQVERFIHTVYAHRHGARVRQFMPWLVSLSDADGIVAAAGYRLGHEALFLERYLDHPVEQLLARAGTPVSRHTLAEVGHLAAARAGLGRQLIVQMGPHLAGLGVEWVVSTLTQELRHLFSRMGVTPLALGVADPARLGADAADWGRYYDHHPMVLAGHLPQALRRLLRRHAAAGRPGHGGGCR